MRSNVFILGLTRAFGPYWMSPDRMKPKKKLHPCRIPGIPPCRGQSTTVRCALDLALHSWVSTALSIQAANAYLYSISIGQT